MASELIMLQSELAREIHAETQFSGALLQKVRESQGVEIADIAAKTKIAANHLRAIEQDDLRGAARAGLHARLRPRARQVLAPRPLAGGPNILEANARSARSLGPHRELGSVRDRRHDDIFFSAVLGLVAFFPRLYVAIAWTREPVWDGHYYDFGARRIAAGLGYSDGAGGWHPWCHWPVGYSGIIAATYRVFGHGPHIATIFNAFTGALLAVFTHRLARYELSANRARAAGLLCALYPGLIIYSALVMTEPLSALALVVAGWCWARYRRDRPLLGVALFGLVIGLGTLVHPSLLVFAPAPLLLAGDTLSASLRPAALKRGIALAAISTAFAFLPVLPWTIRNCRVMDRCTLVSTNGGWNLAIGSFARATGRFETLRSSDGCAVVTGQSPTGRLLARCRAKNHSQRSRAMARPRPEEARLHVRSRVVPGRIPPRSRSRSLA